MPGGILATFLLLPGHVSSSSVLQSQPWDCLLNSLRALRRGSAGRVIDLPLGAGFPGTKQQCENENTSRGSKMYLSPLTCAPLIFQSPCWEGVLPFESIFPFSRYHTISWLALGCDLCYSICPEKNQCPACLPLLEV